MNDAALAILERLWAVDHALESLSRAMLTAHGVTGAQRFALRRVDARPGLTPGELARGLRVDPSTLTAMLHRLEQRGLLRREPDPVDHRRARLHITDEGRHLANQPLGTVESALSHTLAPLGAEDLQLLTAWLDRLTWQLEQERQLLLESPR